MLENVVVTSCMTVFATTGEEPGRRMAYRRSNKKVSKISSTISMFTNEYRDRLRSGGQRTFCTRIVRLAGSIAKSLHEC